MDGREKILKAMANKRRMAIMRHLRDGRKASVGEIADRIGLSLKATSKHLNILFAADILEREQRSLQMLYRVAGQLDPLSSAIVKLL